MHNRRLFDLVLLGVWLFIAIIITVDYDVKNNNTQKNLDFSNSEIEIEKITVVDNSLDISLKNRKGRVILMLPVEQTQKALNILSGAGKKVIVYDEKKGLPVLKLFVRGKEVVLDDYLSNESVEK